MLVLHVISLNEAQMLSAAASRELAAEEGTLLVE